MRGACAGVATRGACAGALLIGACAGAPLSGLIGACAGAFPPVQSRGSPVPRFQAFLGLLGLVKAATSSPAAEPSLSFGSTRLAGTQGALDEL